MLPLSKYVIVIYNCHMHRRSPLIIVLPLQSLFDGEIIAKEITEQFLLQCSAKLTKLRDEINAMGEERNYVRVVM